MPATHVCVGSIIHGSGWQPPGTAIDASTIGPKTLKALLAEGRLVTVKQWELRQALAEAQAAVDDETELLPDPLPEVRKDPSTLAPLDWKEASDEDPEMVQTRIVDAIQDDRPLKTKSLRWGIKAAKFADDAEAMLLSLLE